MPKKPTYYLDTVPARTSNKKLRKLIADAYQVIRDKSNQIHVLQQEIEHLRSVFRVEVCEACGASDVWDVELSMGRDGEVTTPPAAAMTMYSKRCESCRHLQSLGPSVLTTDVLVEIRAAELSDLASSSASMPESRGWLDYARGVDCPRWAAGESLTKSWWAGWLGRAINSHGRG